MKKSTTRADLQRQIDSMQAAVNNLPEHTTLAVSVEHLMDYRMFDRRVDLREVDEHRKHAKHRLARELADELIRSGAIEFREELEDCHRRFCKALRVTAKVKLAA
jgi:hypothetical protein